MTSEALCRFGLISDVQHGDIDDGYNFTRTSQRFYRKSLELLKDAVKQWRNYNVDFVLQLGDLIDGFCKRDNCSDRSLVSTLTALNSLKKPIYHAFGNHEFYNFSRKWLMTSELCSARRQECVGPKDCAYYSVTVHEQLRIIVLDFYEISMLGFDQRDPEYVQAYKLLTDKNNNKNLNAPDGLEGLDRRFVKINGGCSRSQISWLEVQLSEAMNKEQNVIVVGHLPLYEASSHAQNLCWNYDEVMAILKRNIGCLLCYIGGHDHGGGDAVDENGLLHIIMPGVVEAVDSNPFATAYLYQDKLVVKGEGTVPCYQIDLKYPIP